MKLSFKEALAANKKKAPPVEQKAPEKPKKAAVLEPPKHHKKKLEPEQVIELIKDELPKKAHVAFVAARSFILDKVNKWKYEKKYTDRRINIVSTDDCLEFYVNDDDGSKLDSIHVFDVEIDEVVRKHL